MKWLVRMRFMGFRNSTAKKPVGPQDLADRRDTCPRERAADNCPVLSPIIPPLRRPPHQRHNPPASRQTRGGGGASGTGPFPSVSFPGPSLRLAFASLVPPDPSRPPLRQRAASFVLAVGVTLLLIVGLLTLNGSVPQRPQFKGGPILIDLAPEKERADATRTPARTQPEPAPERPAPPP